MQYYIGLFRLAGVHALRAVHALPMPESLKHRTARAVIRQCSLAYRDGVELAALEELFVLHPHFADVPAELAQLAAERGPAQDAARYLEQQVRLEFAC